MVTIVITVLLAAVVILGITVSNNRSALTAQQATLEAQRSTLAAQQATIEDQQKELRSSCGFWEPLTTLPVTIVPPANKPTELSVVLIIASRTAYQGQECGPLPTASVSLTRWASYFHIPVP